MADIIHRIGIRKPVGEVYQALTTLEGLSGWWTEDTSGSVAVAGLVTFTFKTKAGDVIGKMVMRVTALEKNKSVNWRCEDGPPDWIGTNFTFDLNPEKDMTILNFGHRNWKESSESMAHCSMKWAVFLLSLKDLVQSGKGHPSPNDIKIDNWN